MRLLDRKGFDLHQMLGKSSRNIIPNGGWLHGDESHDTIRKNSPKKQTQVNVCLFTSMFG